METVKTVASAICCGMVALGVFKLLVPDGKLKRSAEIVFAVAAVLTLALPLAGGIGVNIQWDSYKKAESDVNIQMSEICAAQSKSAIAQLLRAASINYGEIYVDTDISETDGIFIKYVRITKTDQSEKEKVKGLIAGGMNIDPKSVEVTDE